MERIGCNSVSSSDPLVFEEYTILNRIVYAIALAVFGLFACCFAPEWVDRVWTIVTTGRFEPEASIDQSDSLYSAEEVEKESVVEPHFAGISVFSVSSEGTRSWSTEQFFEERGSQETGKVFEVDEGSEVVEVGVITKLLLPEDELVLSALSEDEEGGRVDVGNVVQERELSPETVIPVRELSPEAVISVREPSLEPFVMRLTPYQKKEMDKVFSIVGVDATLWLGTVTWNATYLRKAQSELNMIPCLQGFSYIFTTPLLVKQLKRVQKRPLIWEEFVANYQSCFVRDLQAGALLPELAGFAKFLNADYKKLLQAANSGNCIAFLDVLLSKHI